MFSSIIKNIQKRNNRHYSVLFSVICERKIHGNKFEIQTLVSEINENVDLVIGLKIMNDLEAERKEEKREDSNVSHSQVDLV